MVVVSSSGWESQSSGLFLYRFSWMLYRIATRRVCTFFASRRPGEAPLVCLSAQRTVLANWMSWRASFSWSS